MGGHRPQWSGSAWEVGLRELGLRVCGHKVGRNRGSKEAPASALELLYTNFTWKEQASLPARVLNGKWKSKELLRVNYFTKTVLG